MSTMQAVFLNPSVRGHTLMAPALWLGHHVSRLFTEPLPEQHKPYEIVARAVTLVVLAVLSLTLIVTGPAALIGMCIKYQNREPLPPPAVVPSEPVAAPLADQGDLIRRAADDLTRQMEPIYRDLQLIQGPVGDRLVRDVQSFRDLYGQAPREAGLEKAFGTIAEIENNIRVLRSLFHGYQEVLNLYFASQGPDARGIVRQPKDGNCWLHTALFGLRDLRRDQGYTYATLRPAVIHWMRVNYNKNKDSMLRGYIVGIPGDDSVIGAIENHKHVEAGHIAEERQSLNDAFESKFITEEEQRQGEQLLNQRSAALASFNFRAYFLHMQQDHSHGSRAELYALSKMFHVDVVIWRDRPQGLSREFDVPITALTNTGTINAVLNQVGNHYDFLVPPVM